MDEALEQYRIALSLDRSRRSSAQLRFVLMEARRYPSPRPISESSRARSEFSTGHYKLSQLYAAPAAFLRRERNAEGFSESRSRKRRAKATSTGHAMTDFDRSSAVAVAYALAGNRQQAFEYLEKAYADGDSEMLFVIRNPALDPLRSTPASKT